MTLPVDMVSIAHSILSSEEMIQSNFPQMRCTCISRNVSTNALEIFVPTRDHHHCIPSNHILDSLLHLQIPRILWLIIWMNTIDVSSLCQLTDRNTNFICSNDRFLQQLAGALGPKIFLDRNNRISPFLRFALVGVRKRTSIVAIFHTIASVVRYIGRY